VFFTGELRHHDIEVRFGVKPAAASRDLALYWEFAPENLGYDAVSRCYRPTPNFKPFNEFHAERVLSRLLQGFGDGLSVRADPNLSHCADPILSQGW
jgi:hypothetical protein